MSSELNVLLGGVAGLEDECSWVCCVLLEAAPPSLAPPFSLSFLADSGGQLSSFMPVHHDVSELEPLDHALNPLNCELNKTSPPSSGDCWAFCCNSEKED